MLLFRRLYIPLFLLRQRGRRVLCLTLGLLVASACQFQPLYQKHHLTEGTSGELAAIKPITLNRTRNAQILRTDLEDLFGRSELAAYQYTLEIELTDDIYPTSVNPDGAVARFNITMAAHYRLRDLEGKLITEGDIRRISSHNVVDSDYATYRANREAYARAARALAEGLRNRLISYLHSHPDLRAADEEKTF